jgi:hypothetical protein
MTEWMGDILSAIGGGIVVLGLIIFSSGVPVELSHLSKYHLSLSLFIIVIGGSLGIYGLGIGSEKSRKGRIIEFIYDLMGTA